MSWKNSIRDISGYLFVFLGIYFAGANYIWIYKGNGCSFSCSNSCFLYLSPLVLQLLILTKVVLWFCLVAYKGTIKTNGFYWVNPFFVRRKISLAGTKF